MIFTTYFAQLRNLPENIIPVSICGRTPDWYTGLQYKKLAPKWAFFQEWKKNHDNNYYIEHFNAEVLAPLTAQQVVEELRSRLPDGAKDIALVCYEKPNDFCHRHLVGATEIGGKLIWQQFSMAQESPRKSSGKFGKRWTI